MGIVKRAIIALILWSAVVPYAYAGWLTGWDQRVKLTIDNTKIDSELFHFPVTVILSPTHGDCVFDELTADANRLKIAFTKSDGTTEMYGEIEKWDDANESAVIHVSLAGWGIASDVDTNFYLYYDVDHADNSTYIGDSGSAAAQGVWNSGYEFVYHMVDATSSTILDSTLHDDDGSKTEIDNPVEISGMVGFAQSFDGSDDTVLFSGIADAFGDDYYTIDFLVKPMDITTPAYWSDFSSGNNSAVLIGYQSGYFNIFGGSYPTGAASNTQIAATGVGSYDLLTFTKTINNLHGYRNGTLIFNVNRIQGNFSPGSGYAIGALYAGTGHAEGVIDEVRGSNIERSAAWIKATYNTLWDTLLTYGSEEVLGEVSSGNMMFGTNF